MLKLFNYIAHSKEYSIFALILRPIMDYLGLIVVY